MLFILIVDANAMMTRISLLCKVAAPVVFGIVLYYTSIVVVSTYLFYYKKNR